MNKTRKRIILSVVIPAAAVIAAFALYAAAHIYIQNYGISLHTDKEIPVNVSAWYLQNDPRWSDEKIGESNLSMGSSGCLIASAATAVTELGEDINPHELNERLTAADGYIGADLIWYKLNEAVPAVDYSYSRIFSSRRIEKDLENGLLPIINVKYHKTGVTHWLLAVGCENGDFLVLDPMGDSSEADMRPMPLSEHGNVYSYRVIVPSSD